MNQRTRWLLVLVTAVGLISPIRAARADDVPPGAVPFGDHFEGDEPEFWWSILVEGAGSVACTADRAYYQDQSLRLTSGGPGSDVRLVHPFTEPTYGDFWVAFYESAEIGSGNKAGLYVSNSLTGDYLGIVTPSSGEGNYEIDLPSGPLDTGYARTAGWRWFAISALHSGLSAGIGEVGGPFTVLYAGDARAFDGGELRMTASASASPGAAYFDEYGFLMDWEAPEPGTAALLFTGVLGVVGAIVYSRVKKT